MTEYLLDTCTFLWLSKHPLKLTAKVREIIEEPRNTLYLSAVSAYEIALKYSIGKLELSENPEHFVEIACALHDIDILPLLAKAALHVFRLPALHSDPFDRLLICQSITSGIPIITNDRKIKEYSIVRTVW